MVRKMTAVAAYIAMSAQAMAATSLCVVDESTGFNWENGRWTQVNFSPSQHIVRKVDSGEDIASLCADRLSSEGLSEAPVKGKYGTRSAGCYAMYEVGEEPSVADVQMCKEIWGDDGAVGYIDCTAGGFDQYRLVPSGEFIPYRTYSAPMALPVDRESRDSLVISIGKCSVIAP